jgi:hypothetical protein
MIERARSRRRSIQKDPREKLAQAGMRYLDLGDLDGIEDLDVEEIEDVDEDEA